MVSIFSLSLTLALVACGVALLLPQSFQFFPPVAVTGSQRQSCVAYTSHGDTSVLEHGHNCPVPSLGETQIMVKAEYASLNPCDFKFRRMSLPLPAVTGEILDFLFPKPKIPALDVAGTVSAVGPKVASFKVGDRVAATQPILHTPWGTLAQYSAVEESHASLVPLGVSLRDAAAVSLVGLTTLQAFESVEHGPGSRALVHAGSGGLGSFAVQWAKSVRKVRRGP